ncbi:MAG: division/cell wall cluster transcriptional repressor MraZ [Alphaproteobacteria bacterium]|nr:division/cell wall cluster transcriptional repressor MraZ [Alphaproteobacteria bacterium]
MPLFLSTYVNKIDKKGRVSVPSSFRSEMAGQSFQGVVLFRSNNHDCLEGFSRSTMQEIGERLDEFDLFSAEQDDLATSVFGEAQQLPMDGEGRIILPTSLIDFAKLEDQACFVGLGAKFHIWNPALYEARREAARENVRAEGLTIPKVQNNKTQNGGGVA